MFYLPTGKFVFLALVIAVSLVHLFYPKGKKITKALLLPSIILFYLTASETPELLFVLALAASWLGDVLLEVKGDRWFVFGGISFMLSHLLLIVSYLFRTDPDAVPPVPVVLTAVAFCAATALEMTFIKEGTGKMYVPLFFYLTVNAAMNVFAFTRLYSAFSVPSLVTAAGAVLFFISDCVLFVGKFSVKKRYKTFYACMGTYIAGELLITLGMIR